MIFLIFLLEMIRMPFIHFHPCFSQFFLFLKYIKCSVPPFSPKSTSSLIQNLANILASTDLVQ